MNILFVIKKIEFGDYISISYLSSIAKIRGHNVDICILDNNNIFNMVNDFEPDIIAYSANILGYDEMVEVNAELKNNHEFISIMGGAQPTFEPDLFPDSSMDIFCIGEGELVFEEFLEKVENNEPYDNVLNLITKKRINPIRNLIDNLDDLPLPDRNLTINNSFLKDSSKKSVFTSRGCPYSCSYCCNSYYNKMYKGKGKIIRRFSVDRIIEEIKHLINDCNVDFIKFGDDLFALKADDWLKEFSKKYKSEIDIPFNCYLRLDMISDELLLLLKNAGCYSVHLSVDSCSKNVRDNIFNRKWKNIDIKEKLLLVKKYGINTWVNFMLAAPESTLEDDLEAIELARRAKITYTAYSTTIPINNTVLYNYCIDHNYIDKDYKGDIGNSQYKSPLNCFSEKEKNIRYNILCLGPLASKLPYPFYKILLFTIKHVPPNRLFKKIRDRYLRYSRKNNIFKIKV